MPKHVKKMFLTWHQEPQGSERRKQIERHLAECPSCKSFFDQMSSFFAEARREDSLPLTAGPFVPRTIRIVTPSVSPFRIVPWPVGAAIFALALGIGIYLGSGLSPASSSGQEDVLENYYNAVSQQNFGSTMTQLMDTSGRTR